ncbi:MAG: stage II sporulation protein M [Rhodospirillaceae bacterium]|nr:stage II sporulation protein M [Rhodospirillaceae bacterium]
MSTDVRGRIFQLMLAAHLVLFAAGAVLGWWRPPYPEASAQAPEFFGVMDAAGAILLQNLGALTLLVLGNVVSVGTFGVVVYVVNGYLAGALMRTVEYTAPHVPPWLWSFVLPEVFAFAYAGAAAVAAVVGMTNIRDAVHMVGFSAVILCTSAVFEAIVVRWAWGL